MNLSGTAPRAFLGLLTGAAILTLAAPLLSLARCALASAPPGEETTVTIQTGKSGAPTVVKIPTMKVGETKALTGEKGKPVSITRTEDGYSIKVGEKKIEVKTRVSKSGTHVVLDEEKDGETSTSFVTVTDDDEKKGHVRTRKIVVKGDGHGFHTGPGGKVDVKAFLAERKPKALEGLDAKTREAVEKTLQELADDEAIFVMPVRASGGEGEEVKVIVVKEKDEPKE